MYNAMKILIFAGVLAAAAIFANLFGWVSIPWLDVNSVATYGEDANQSDRALKKIVEE